MLIVKSKQRMKSSSILSTQLITLGIAEKGNKTAPVIKYPLRQLQESQLSYYTFTWNSLKAL